MKCLIVQPIHEDGLSVLRRAGVEPVVCPDPSMSTVARLVGGCEAAITRNAGFSAEAFAAADRMRVLAVHGTGYDAIDMPAATQKRILVCNTPGLNAQSVAELALGLALSCARLIPSADRDERQGRDGFRERHHTRELAGKTALVVGWGHTGRALGRMLQAALRMRVLAFSSRPPELEGVEHVASVEGALPEADLVSLHVPLSERTRSLLGRRQFDLVKPGTILVNTARAGLIDETALAEALASGRLFAAGLDTYEDGSARGPLAASERVIFTPHLGGATEDAMRRTAIEAATLVLEVLAGGQPSTTLNGGSSLPGQGAPV